MKKVVVGKLGVDLGRKRKEFKKSELDASLGDLKKLRASNKTHLVHVTKVFSCLKDGLVGAGPTNKFKKLYKRKGIKPKGQGLRLRLGRLEGAES
uniref:Uncharacterized protein n=1 Tax=Nelumbo nucifera TaxID=4432 RepID=A0A822Z590_NELNU|nr:TPA_asm: hypothetical protein HUJ06_013183 [Nelumbo nucifera]